MTEYQHPCAVVGVEQLTALAAGQLSAPEAQTLRQHLGVCPHCQRFFQSALALEQLSAVLPPTEVPPELADKLWATLEPEARRAAWRARWRGLLEPLKEGLALPLTAAAVMVVLLMLVARWYVAKEGAEGEARPPALTATLPQTSGPARPDLLERAPRRPLADLEQASPLDPREYEPRTAPEAPLAALEPAPALETPPPPQVTPPPSGDEMKRLLAASAPPEAPVEGPEVLRTPRTSDQPMRLASGATLSFQEARVRVLVDQPQRALLELASGGVEAAVPRLPPGGSLELTTPDARVTVKGTRFQVEGLGKGGTKVGVQEGTVWVQPSGRKRDRVVLTAGQEATVKGEALYLQDLLEEMGRAVMKDDLEGARQLGRRYLEVTSAPERAGEMKNRLAGVLEELQRYDEARALYRETAKGQDAPLVRQNAWLLLARSLEKTDGPAAALDPRLELWHRFPKGAYLRENLLWLGRAGCEDPKLWPELRPALEADLPGDEQAQGLLARCQGGTR